VFHSGSTGSWTPQTHGLDNTVAPTNRRRLSKASSDSQAIQGSWLNQDQTCCLNQVFWLALSPGCTTMPPPWQVAEHGILSSPSGEGQGESPPATGSFVRLKWTFLNSDVPGGKVLLQGSRSRSTASTMACLCLNGGVFRLSPRPLGPKAQGCGSHSNPSLPIRVTVICLRPPEVQT
jgi:hypothetical protein